MAEPEYGTDEYLLKKWNKPLSGIQNAKDRLMVAHMLENQSNYEKAPIQVLAEEGLRDLDSIEEPPQEGAS